MLKRNHLKAVVAGRENGFKDKTNRKLAAVVAETYRRAMGRFSEMPTLDVWYYHVDEADVVTERDYQALVDAVKSGRLAAETGV